MADLFRFQVARSPQRRVPVAEPLDPLGFGDLGQLANAFLNTPAERERYHARMATAGGGAVPALLQQIAVLLGAPLEQRLALARTLVTDAESVGQPQSKPLQSSIAPL